MQPTFLARYTPSLMSAETLEAIFVQRQKIAARLVSLMGDSVKTTAKHHALLIGPRGIGKTHLIALIYHRLQAQADLHPSLLVAWLREEEWGVDSFLDLLLRIFRALDEEYPDARLAERLEPLYHQPPAEAEGAAAALLKEFADGRTLILLVENLDELFRGLGEKGQQRLRSYIQENSFWAVLSTSQALFNGVSLQTSPFYGFFHIHHLEGLEFDESVHLLENIARQQDDRELAALIPSPLGRARIRVLRHLAGGNHRVHVIFSQFLTRDALDDLIEPFLAMLDDLTPYYQARIAWLSPQQRKIIEYLCEARGAIPVKQIAQRNFMTHQTASSQLKKLHSWGYVHSQTEGRESFYELHEPLMRLCIEMKKSRGGPIGLFVDFLRLWYSPPDLRQHLTQLSPDAVHEREYVKHALRENKRPLVGGIVQTGQELGENQEENAFVSLSLRDYETYVEDGDFNRALDAAEEMVAVRGDAEDWRRKGKVLVELNRYEEALAAYDQALKIEPKYAYAWNNRGQILANLGRHEEALDAYQKTLEIDPEDTTTWYNRGWALCKLGHRAEALFACDKIVEDNPKNSGSWHQRAIILDELEMVEEALNACNRALKLEPESSINWNNRGWALFELGRYEEALNAYEKAIEINPDGNDSDIAFNRAGTLLALDRWSEGLKQLKDALDRFEKTHRQHKRNLKLVLQNLFNNVDPALWPSRIVALVKLYDQLTLLPDLSQTLVQSIPTLFAPESSAGAAQSWFDSWQQSAADQPQLTIALRLFKTAVRFRQSADPRDLLALPIEERQILEEVLPKTAAVS